MSEPDAAKHLSAEQRAKALAHQVETLRHIPEWLRFRGLRQKHIANALQVSESVVSRYFSGKTMMPLGALREIAVLLNAHPGDIIRPPPADGLGEQVEKTLAEMDRLGPDQWARVLELVRGMKGKSEV